MDRTLPKWQAWCGSAGSKHKKPGAFAILHIYEDIHNSVHLVQKEEGFLDYFQKKDDKDFKALGVDYSHPEEPSLEKELSSLLLNPDIRGMLITTSKGLHLAASYLEKHKRNNIRLVGYDLLKENIEYLEKGVIDFLIHQNPKKQAALGINYLANHLLFKKETPEILKREDNDVSDTMLNFLKEKGIEFRLQADCITGNKNDDGTISVQVNCALGGPPEINGSHLLLAVGRVPNSICSTLPPLR